MPRAYFRDRRFEARAKAAVRPRSLREKEAKPVNFAPDTVLSRDGRKGFIIFELAVEWLSCFQDSIGEDQQFAHDCADNTHLGLAFFSEPFRKSLDDFVAFYCGDGWPV